MKLQPITFETAKLAHEKGFRADDALNSRMGCYALEDLEVWQIGIPDHWKDDIEKGHYFQKEPELTEEYRPRWRDVLAWAPAQALLQRWLREEHDIHVWLRHRVGKYSYWIGKRSPKQKEKLYEEALEDGLQAGLELIQQE